MRVGGGLQFFQRRGEGVRRGRQLEVFGGEDADALAVHRRVRGEGGGDHCGETIGLDADEFVGGDGLDFGHDQMRPFGLHQRAQGLGIGHVDDMGAVGDLLGGRIGIAVDGDHLDAVALQLDGDFLAELARAQEHDPGRGWRKRSSDGHGTSQRFVMAALVAATQEHRPIIVFMGRRDKPGDDEVGDRYLSSCPDRPACSC